VFILALLSCYFLNEKRNNYYENIEKLKDFKKNTHNYKALKEGWYSEKKIKKDIDLLVLDSKFKDSRITRSFANNIATIRLDSKNRQTINYFVSSLMHKKLRITNLFITDKFVQVEVLIK